MVRGRRRHTDRDKARGQRLAQRLIQERGTRTRYDIADQAGISPDTIKRIENGLTVDPGFFTVVDLAAVFSVGLDDLARAADVDKL